jgi:hypothetical protein
MGFPWVSSEMGVSRHRSELHFEDRSVEIDETELSDETILRPQTVSPGQDSEPSSPDTGVINDFFRLGRGLWIFLSNCAL